MAAAICAHHRLIGNAVLGTCIWHGGQRPGGSKENDIFPGAVTMDIIPESILVDSGAQISCVRESAMDMIVHVN